MVEEAGPSAHGFPFRISPRTFLLLRSSFRETCCDLVTRQAFPAAALLSVGTGYFSGVDCPVRCRVFSSISGLYSLLARSTPSCDNQKYLHMWPALPRQVRSLFAENHGSKGWWHSNLIFPRDPLSSIHVPLHCVDFCPHWGCSCLWADTSPESGTDSRVYEPLHKTINRLKHNVDFYQKNLGWSLLNTNGELHKYFFLTSFLRKMT